nr:MAG TPA: hypothetical protein [Caudoviricetes sp.]
MALLQLLLHNNQRSSIAMETTSETVTAILIRVITNMVVP